MNLIRRLYAWVAAYASHPDPLVAGSNSIALVVASNQPFYPIYVWIFVGWDNGASLVSLLTTPMFAAVPAIARRNPWLARALLPLVGIFNTLMNAKALGQDSGVELFLFPCAMIAAMSLRRFERVTLLVILGVAFIGFEALHGRYGTPFHLFSAEQYARFVVMNATSVACLTGLAAINFSGADARTARV
jgi:hypothetical protein